VLKMRFEAALAVVSRTRITASGRIAGLNGGVWKEESGRGERIRTSGLYVPNVALYQAKLHPEGPMGRSPAVVDRLCLLRSVAPADQPPIVSKPRCSH
jgi:hypothetical protein